MDFVFLASDSWWQVLLGHMAELGLAFAVPILTVLGSLFIVWISKKLKITDVEKQFAMQEAYDRILETGISYAEQEAYKLKNDPKHGSAEKLNSAMTFVVKMIKDWKLPEKSSDWIEKKIEAKLGESKVDYQKLKELQDKKETPVVKETSEIK